MYVNFLWANIAENDLSRHPLPWRTRTGADVKAENFRRELNRIRLAPLVWVGDRVVNEIMAEPRHPVVDRQWVVIVVVVRWMDEFGRGIFRRV